MTRLLICLFMLAPALTAQQATVSSIFNDPVVGKITKLDVQGRLEIEVKGSDVPQRISLDETEEVAFGHKGDERKPDLSPLRVYLVNGDVLHGAPGDQPADDDELFVLKGTRFGSLRIDIDSVKRIEVVRNVEPNILPEPEEKQDVAYFAASDTQPAQADPSSELVRIVKDGVYLYNSILDGENYDGVKYSWNRLRGVVCYRSNYEPYEKLLGICTLRDGSVLRGVIKSWSEGKVTIHHVELDSDVTLEENALISVTMKNGRYMYLSDLEYADTPKERPYYLPSDFKYADYLFKARRDQAQGGGALSIRGKVYAKGLGVHAISKVTFDLNRGYKRFLCDIGVDDSAGDLASVEFKVYADGKLVFESGVLRRTTDVKNIDIDVLNVSELVLEVTAADNADIQDRANWANAKVVR
ncbi:MAG: NPCBM/NEW2 domain-containing protein [Planctomycetes bacterium]|nr:NPCBM/NEW2 domain-containing protein [Planctomycetota bacterium]MCA8947125.1 NPCBM/NEW2 domain-containing protein [Planctomycetota bacterium]